MGVIEEVVKSVTESKRILCPACANKRKKSKEPTLVITVDEQGKVYHCHHCNAKGNISHPSPIKIKKREFNVTPISINYKQNQQLISDFLFKRGIKYDKNFPVISGRKFFHGHGELDAIGFVYGDAKNPTAIKWRGAEEKVFTQDGVAKEFYLGDKVLKKDKELIIVEGECDALALLSIGVKSVSCPNGAPQKVSNKMVMPEEDNKFSYIWEFRDHFEHLEKIILAVDNDEAGEALAEEIARRVGRAKCWRIQFPEDCKDFNDVLRDYGEDEVKRLIKDAVPVPLDGVYSANDYKKSVQEIYDKGIGRGISTGLKSIDDLFTIAEGQLSVVTGIPSSGKSEFIDQIMINLAQNNHWKFAVCSFENPPHYHIAKLAEKIVGSPFFQSIEKRMNEKQLEDALNFINEHFVFLEQKEGGMSSIESIIDRTKQAVMRLGIRGLIIDPYNYIDMSTERDEHQNISSMLTKISSFAKSHGIHVWFVAHPSKMYPNADGTMPVPKGMSISGSASWFAKADLGITVHRGDQGVEIHCWKSRFKWIGSQGMKLLNYDIITGKYSDEIEIKGSDMTPTSRSNPFND